MAAGGDVERTLHPCSTPTRRATPSSTACCTTSSPAPRRRSASRSSAPTCRGRSRSGRVTCTATATSSSWCGSGPTRSRRPRCGGCTRDLPHRDGFWNRTPRGLVRRRRRPAPPRPGWAGSGSTSTTAADEHGVVGALQPAVDPLDPARARHHARRPVPGRADGARARRRAPRQRAGRAGDAHRRRPRAGARRRIAWCQRYLVVQASRSLYTIRTGEVASKRDALRWVDDARRPSLAAAAPAGARRPRARLRPGGASRDRARWTAARDFAAYVAAVALSCATLRGMEQPEVEPSAVEPSARSTSTTRSCASSGTSPATTPSSTPRRPTSGPPRWSPCRRRHGPTASRRRSPTRSSATVLADERGEHDRARWPTTPASYPRPASCPSSATAPAGRARSSRSAT